MSNSSLNVEKCPFVVGEMYKTRDGRDAECVALRPRAGHVIFAIQDEASEYSGSWPLNGILYPDTESCDDILPPKPKVVERWVAVYSDGVKYAVGSHTYESYEQARFVCPNAHSYHKIEVPE